jgi:hypothetical protein
VLSALEPAAGKLSATVGHVLTAEDTEFKQFFRRHFWLEVGIETTTSGSYQGVTVSLLHSVIHCDDFPHFYSLRLVNFIFVPLSFGWDASLFHHIVGAQHRRHDEVMSSGGAIIERAT